VDDPGPTLGLPAPRRPPEAIRGFWERIGVAKRNSTIDVAMLEHAIRRI
jgi:glutaminyl-tRNA synthetase